MADRTAITSPFARAVSPSVWQPRYPCSLSKRLKGLGICVAGIIFMPLFLRRDTITLPKSTSGAPASLGGSPEALLPLTRRERLGGVSYDAWESLRPAVGAAVKNQDYPYGGSRYSTDGKARLRDAGAAAAATPAASVNALELEPTFAVAAVAAPLFERNVCQLPLAEVLRTVRQFHARNGGLAPTRGRGLFAVAAGHSAAHLTNDTVSHFLEFPEFDVVILAYDGYDWLDIARHPWAALGEPRVRVIREPNGLKYAVAKRHLPADHLQRQGYSHLFLWDDDIELQPDFCARDVLMTLQLTSQIKVAAPLVTGDCHLSCWANDEMQTAKAMLREGERASWAHLLIQTPEMMVPIYSVDAWSCYAELVDDETPECWGIDSVTAGCLCEHAGATLHGPGQAMLLHATVAHVNLRSLAQPGRANIERARAFETKIVEALAKRPGGQACADLGRPLRQDGAQAHIATGACFVPP